MPNHVTIRGTAIGAPDALRAFVGHFENETPDFEKLIPMPEALRTESSNRADEAVALARFRDDGNREPLRAMLAYRWPTSARIHTVDDLAAWIEANVPWALDWGRMLLENERIYGHRNWYYWAVANWGTKWNAYDGELDASGIEDRIVRFKFETAWSVPWPYLEELGAACPTLTIAADYFDEGWNFAGRFVVRGREIVDDDVDPEDRAAMRAAYLAAYGEPYEDEDDAAIEAVSP